jgi:type II secretory pathway pseudopilin PulG
MLTFADAFAQAYNAGLHRRWLEEQEEKKRQEQEAAGKALYDMLYKDFEQRRLAGIAPAARNVETAVAPMQDIDYAKLAGVASGAPGALVELAKLHGAQAATEKKLLPAARSYNQASAAYANPLEGVRNLPGSVFVKVLPTLLQLAENREAQYKQHQQQAAREAYRASLAPEQRSIFDASEYAKPDVLKLMFPQDSYAGTGGVIYNKNTGKTVYEKPAAINYHYTTDNDGNVWQVNPKTGEKRNLGPIGKAQAGGYDKVQIAQANRDIAAHNRAYQAALRLDPDADETKLPTYEAAQRAQVYLSGVMPYQAGERQPAGEGMSPVIKRFAEELNYDIETKGPDFARQWIKANADALRQRGIDPDIALTWIP